MRFKKAKKLFDEYNTKWKDNHVYSHGMKVMGDAIEICEELNIERSHSINIQLAARYHDIGKIMFPERMADPNLRFTKRDIRRYRKHAKYSYDILKGFYGNDSIAKLALYHHEKIDGSGYPKGLKGEEIPLGSRIITVCDAYDAMFRHYCQKTKDQALKELEDNKGAHFDEKVIDAFLKILEGKNENNK